MDSSDEPAPTAVDTDRAHVLHRVASEVLHEANNAFMGVACSAGLAADELSPDSPAQVYLAEIDTTLQRVAALTREFMALGHEGDGRPVPVRELITRLRPLLERVAGRSVALRVELGPDLGAVQVERPMMEYILLAAVLDARDRMSGLGTIQIDAQRRDDRVAITISDDDPGGPAAARLGSIRVAARPGQVRVSQTVTGTQLELSFLADGAPIEAAQALRPEAVLAKRVVLVVEDDAPSRRALRLILSSAAMEVLEAETPDAALALVRARSGPIDVLLSDLNLPGGGGPRLHAELERLRPELKVIFMSGYSAEEAAVRGLLKAGQPFLPKPIDIDVLLELLRRVVATAPGG